MESKQRTKAIESSIQRFRDGKDYHRQFLDQYLPIEGLIGDIGCAEGRIGAFYHSEKRRFVAFDTDAEVLAIGQKLYPAIDFRLGSAYNLPLPDQCLDAYIGLGIFELDGMNGAVAAAEAARVTKKGGMLYISVPFSNLLRQYFGVQARWRGVELPHFSKKQMKVLLDLHGFDIEFVRPSSLAHGLGPFRRLASIFPGVLDKEDHRSIGYKVFGPILRPFANSLLVVARRRS